MKVQTLSLAFASVLLLQAAPVAASGDTLLVERVQAEPAFTLPTRGTTMAQVEARFGAPARKHAPVAGPNSTRFNPPITRWDYADFSVYFEHSHVVDAVLRKASPEEVGPRPVQ
ncbi:hypothetical protein [Arenimonas composti]|uniref:Phosphodiesterase n=1 Tax=Arenimonas composti TR7-09 = DSM 18010 TaxID=1121013 RepID=A0A091AY85_9GAMM|nr:hypothetical protein [Arenimonas composti]KFN45283.1 hypothetical protein P873_02350 [Arenimonas composti TR7-09 = DSM 18010]